MRAGEMATIRERRRRVKRMKRNGSVGVQEAGVEAGAGVEERGAGGAPGMSTMRKERRKTGKRTKRMTERVVRLSGLVPVAGQGPEAGAEAAGVGGEAGKG